MILRDSVTKRADCDIAEAMCLEFEIGLYAWLQQELPKLAASLRPDYVAWINMEAEIHRDNGSFKIGDLEKRLPGNRWCVLVKLVACSQIPTWDASGKVVARENLREQVALKMREE